MENSGTDINFYSLRKSACSRTLVCPQNTVNLNKTLMGRDLSSKKHNETQLGVFKAFGSANKQYVWRRIQMLYEKRKI